MPHPGSRTPDYHPYHKQRRLQQQQQSEPIRNRTILFLMLLIFRVLNSLLIQTSFAPDEYWQSMEVAHKWTFGYGSLTWEWHPQIALRSPFHPLLIAIVYRLVALLGLDYRLVIIYAPRLLHAFLASLTDFYLYKMVYSVCGPQLAKWTLFHQLSNWFTFYCGPRTLVNCLEWCLTTVGLSYYPWHLDQSDPTKSTNPVFVLIGVICVLIRPTAAVIWFPLCLLHIYQWCRLAQPKERRIGSWFECFHHHVLTLTPILTTYLTVALPCLIGSILLDRLVYGYWTCTQWNFIQFNLLSQGSEAYGTHPWHWYVTQGWPALLTSQLVWVIYAVKLEFGQSLDDNKYAKALAKLSQPSLIWLAIYLSVWTVFCYSLLAHKEFRFIFPLQPLLMCLCGRSTHHFIHCFNSSRRFVESIRNRQRFVILFTLLTQLPLALYASIVHQRGGLDTVLKIGHALDNSRSVGRMDQVELLALMPCHSVPSVSFLHHNVTFRQLNCDPNLPVLFPNASYVDEADLFYENPGQWLLSNYERVRKPNYIMAFDHLTKYDPLVGQILTKQWGYRLCQQVFFGQFLTHRRHGHEIHVYCDSNTDL